MRWSALTIVVHCVLGALSLVTGPEARFRRLMARGPDLWAGEANGAGGQTCGRATGIPLSDDASVFESISL